MTTTLRLTPSDIRRNYIANDNGHFFDRATMKWFGDTMRSYGVVMIDGKTFMYRKPSATVNVFGTRKRAGREFFSCWEVDGDCDLNTVMADVENMVWDAIT